MSLLIKILDFCNILDYNKKISLTNMALIALVLKLILSPTADLSTVGTTIAVMANYMHKRQINSKSEESNDEIRPSDQKPSN